MLLFRAFVNRWEFLPWLPPGMCSKGKSYEHRKMGPCCGPAPQDSSGSKLSQDSLKHDEVKEAMLYVLNPSVGSEHEKNSSEFPRNAQEELPMGQSSNRAQEIVPKIRDRESKNAKELEWPLKIIQSQLSLPMGRDTSHYFRLLKALSNWFQRF